LFSDDTPAAAVEPSAGEREAVRIESPEQFLPPLKGKYEAWRTFIRQVEYRWEECDLDFTGNFFFLPFTADGHPAVDHFVKFVARRIIDYCLPRERRAEFDHEYDESSDSGHLIDLHNEARDLFVRAVKSQKTSGEPGEVILFMLLEAFLGAPQIACKMYLKTSANVPVHGSDSIHITQGVGEGNLRLIWGESKLHKELASALDGICTSISAFLAPKPVPTPREHDISVIQKHIDVDDPDLRELLFRYFDPFDPEHLHLRLEETFACFVGFNYEECKRVANLRGPALEQYFAERYLSRVASACRLFRDRVGDTELKDLTFYFFLLPFPSVEEVRSRFFSELRIA
jgi:hypothetical protein